jgi:hypothetical protein
MSSMHPTPGSASGFEPQVVHVGGVTVTVREAESADAAALLGLYLRLSPEDLHRRFFSSFRPDRGFVERWLDRAHQGGAVLIALEGDAGHERIVADAGYIPTRSDTAELAITVDPERRGWLGPYLLEILVEHARLNGIVDLEAEVLTNNCGMLAMLRARGCAFEPTEDVSVARVLIGTSGDAPSWPADTPHPRVLIEGSSSSWQGVHAAREAGWGVLVCPGPERGRIHPCPLLSGHHCPLVDGADAVVVALPRSAATTSPLLDAHSTYDRDDDRDGDGARSMDQPIGVSANLRDLYGDVPGRQTFPIDPDAPGDGAVRAIADALSRAEADPETETAAPTGEAGRDCDHEEDNRSPR